MKLGTRPLRTADAPLIGIAKLRDGSCACMRRRRSCHTGRGGPSENTACAVTAAPNCYNLRLLSWPRRRCVPQQKPSVLPIWTTAPDPGASRAARAVAEVQVEFVIRFNPAGLQDSALIKIRIASPRGSADSSGPTWAPNHNHWGKGFYGRPRGICERNPFDCRDIGCAGYASGCRR